jgi:hypothetical protein
MNKSSENYALSGEDMMYLVDNKANLEVYPNIHKYRTIEQLMGPRKACILLYEWKKDYGHWTCVFQRGDTIEFFDSYGEPPDEELENVPKHFAHVANEDHDYLMELIRKSGKKSVYNNFDFQKETKGMSTCGRHVCVRLAFRQLPNYEYVLMFLYSGIDPDDLVTYATNIL